MKRKHVFALFGIIFLLIACVPSQQQIEQLASDVEQTAAAQVTFVVPTTNVDQIVQATFQALTAQAPQTPIPTIADTATSTPEAAQVGSMAGSLIYPAEGIPPMAIVAYRVGDSHYQYVLTLGGQNTYQIDNLPVGAYTVVAYSIAGNGFPGGVAGGYTQAVPCGLGADCSDHSLIQVNVTAGTVTDGVDPQDFYAPEGTFPADPVP